MAPFQLKLDHFFYLVHGIGYFYLLTEQLNSIKNKHIIFYYLVQPYGHWTQQHNQWWLQFDQSNVLWWTDGKEIQQHPTYKSHGHNL